MHKPEFSSSEQIFPGILGGKGPSAPELRLRLSPLVYSAHAHTLDTRRRISEYQETDSDPELDKQTIYDEPLRPSLQHNNIMRTKNKSCDVLCQVL